MNKHVAQGFLGLLKIALLGISVPLVVTSQSWAQTNPKLENRPENLSTPAKLTPQPSPLVTPQPRPSATPQPSSLIEVSKTSQPTEDKAEEKSGEAESEKTSEQEKKQEPSLTVIAIGVAIIGIVYLGVLRFRPLLLLWLPAELKVPKIGIIPEFKVPVPISRFLKYRPRVLDAWVNQHIDTFREKFQENETVIERENYVPVPVRLGTREVKELTAEALSETFKKDKRVRLLIWGEGGSGKTTLACQMAKWAMEKKNKSQRLTEHLMLPILVEQDLDSIAGDGIKPLMEALVGTLQELIDSEQTIVDELLVEQLLRQRRILLIVDHFSEMSKATREKIPLSLRDFPANALVVTSRLEEKVPGIDTKIQTVRFDGEELVSFIKNYLQKCGKWELFEEDQEQFLQECSQLVRIVGDKKTITVLLAKLYAQRMINAKEHASASVRSLDNIPDLILDHLEKLNRDVERKTGEEYHTLKEDAKVIAWKCLEQNYKPSYVQCEALVNVWGEKKAEKSLEYFEKQLHLINSGNKGDTIRFALDPLAEYLAGLYLVEDGYKDNEESWRNFLQQIENKSDNREDIKGFLLAVRDCCLAKGANTKVRGLVADEVGKLAGLDLEALKQEQLKRRIQRRISELFVPEAEDRERAAEDLGKIATEEAGNFGLTVKLAVPALLKVANNDGDAGVRFSAAEALDKLGHVPQPVQKMLLMLVEDNQVNYRVRSSAAQALVKLGYVSELVQQTLLALLEDNQADYSVRSSTAWALGNLDHASEPVQQGLLALLVNNKVNSDVRSRAAWALGNLDHASEPVQKTLLALLVDNQVDSEVRLSAAATLVNLGNASEPVQQELLALLVNNKVNSDVRSRAAEALGKLGHSSDIVLQTLLALLVDNQVNFEVRLSAVWALGKLGNASEPLLQKLLALLVDNQADFYIRSQVAETLGKLGNASEPLLQTLLMLLADKTVDSAVHLSAAEALGKLGNASEPVLQTLLMLLADKTVDSGVRLSAAEALGKLGNASEPVLQTLLALLADNTVDSDVRSRATETLGNLGHSSDIVLQGLLTLLANSDVYHWVRSKAAEVLGNLGNSSDNVLQTLLALLENNQVDSWVRVKTAEALINLGNSSEFVQQTLVARFEDKYDYLDVRIKAAEALGKLVKNSDKVQQTLLERQSSKRS